MEFLLAAFLYSRILVIGDSQAYMMQRPFKKIGKEYKAQVFAEAKAGSAAYMWANEYSFGRRLKRYKPELVIISLGTNDAGGIKARKAFPQRANWLVDRAHQDGIKVIWVIPPQNKVRVKHLMDWLREHSRADAIFDTTCMDIKISYDGVHPGLKESKRWAQAVWDFVREGKNPCHRPLPPWFQLIADENGVGIRWTM